MQPKLSRHLMVPAVTQVAAHPPSARPSDGMTTRLKCSLRLYDSPSVLNALEEVTVNMNASPQYFKAVYEQGRKEGRREIIVQMDQIKKTTNYLPPGRPKRA